MATDKELCQLRKDYVVVTHSNFQVFDLVNIDRHTMISVGEVCQKMGDSKTVYTGSICELLTTLIDRVIYEIEVVNSGNIAVLEQYMGWNGAWREVDVWAYKPVTLLRNIITHDSVKAKFYELVRLCKNLGVSKGEVEKMFYDQYVTSRYERRNNTFDIAGNNNA